MAHNHNNHNSLVKYCLDKFLHHLNGMQTLSFTNQCNSTFKQKLPSAGKISST